MTASIVRIHASRGRPQPDTGAAFAEDAVPAHAYAEARWFVAGVLLGAGATALVAGYLWLGGVVLDRLV